MTATASAFGPQRRAMPWWLTLIGGLALIGVGLMLFLRPFNMTVFLVQVLALYWVVTGILELVSLFFDRSAWGWKLLAGIIGILAGYYILTAPAAGALVLGLSLVIIFGIQALILGIVNLIQAFRGAGWGIGILGVVNIIFGVILLTNILAGAVALPWVLGIFAIVGGVAAIFLALRSRRS